MAMDWYLLEPPHVQVSGFEDEVFNDFAQEGFEEILDSNTSVDVELCNHDLSNCNPIKAIVLNNTQDTKLKSLSRNILVPIGTCKSGMYIKYKGRYWIIVGLVDDNTVFEKGVMILCNYLLSWLNSENKVVQRWANITSASQYNSGETNAVHSAMRIYTVRSDQLLIIIPDDDESVLLDSGMRFIIDKRCKVYEKRFDGTVIRDTSNPVLTYEITRSDSVLYDYQDSGHHEFMVNQDEKHDDDGYYVIDGKGYWLCGKPTIEDKKPLLSSKIEYDSLEIYNGIDSSVFSAKFYDDEGNIVDVKPEWTINCNFVDKLDIEYVGNSILISADNNKLINKSFELSLNAENYETISVTVTIRAFI